LIQDIKEPEYTHIMNDKELLNQVKNNKCQFRSHQLSYFWLITFA